MNSPRSVLSINNEHKFVQTKELLLQQCSRKHVSFHSDVLVYNEFQYSVEDRMGMHYTREEMRSFSAEIRQFQIASKTIGAASFKHMSLTGIEAYVNPALMEHKRRHKLQAVLAVLMEQDRQYMELGHFTPIHFDSMSKLYHHATEESKEEAHERALQYSAVPAYDVYAPKANTPMPKAA